MLVPLTYVWFRFQSVQAEKNYFTDAICTLNIKHEYMELSIQSTQSKLCESHEIQYTDIKTFSIIEREVYIKFVDTNKRKQTLRFYVRNDDVQFWQRLADSLRSK